MSEAFDNTAYDDIEGIPRPGAHGFMVGHERVRRDIAHAFQQSRIPQAWLLTGERGIGKATLAWHIAMQLSETGRFTFDYQPSPATVARFADGNHTNIYSLRRELSTTGKSFKTQISVEAVRDVIAKFYLGAGKDVWRVVIIDAAEDMNTSAANALLKLLEEPPTNVLFLLVSHAPERLLPTIRSRAQIARLMPLSPSELAGIWQEFIPYETPAAEALALAEGSFRNLVTFSGDSLTRYDAIVRLFSQAPQIPRAEITRFSQAFQSLSRSDIYDELAKILPLFLARLLRGRELNEIEQQIRANIITPHRAAWAEFALRLSKSLTDAKQLNLDPEAKLINIGVEIDKIATNA